MNKLEGSKQRNDNDHFEIKVSSKFQIVVSSNGISFVLIHSNEEGDL